MTIDEGAEKTYKGLIVSNPSVMAGKPVIAGTRITAELILEKLAASETIEQILDAHPRLGREAILVVRQGWNRRDTFPRGAPRGPRRSP